MHDHSTKTLRTLQKALALILVLSAHAAAAVLVERALKVSHAAGQKSEQPPLLVSFLTLTPSLPPPAPRSEPPQRPRERTPAPHPPIPALEPSTAITPGPDFRAQGADAARHAAGAATRPKPFGHEFAPGPDSPEAGVFGPKNQHPAGTVEQLDGAERHWVTDQCYFDFERHPAFKEMPGPQTLPLHCKPPASGGTDLFKTLRPGYLTPPPPAPGKH